MYYNNGYYYYNYYGGLLEPWEAVYMYDYDGDGELNFDEFVYGC